MSYSLARAYNQAGGSKNPNDYSSDEDYKPYKRNHNQAAKSYSNQDQSSRKHERISFMDSHSKRQTPYTRPSQSQSSSHQHRGRGGGSQVLAVGRLRSDRMTSDSQSKAKRVRARSSTSSSSSSDVESVQGSARSSSLSSVRSDDSEMDLTKSYKTIGEYLHNRKLMVAQMCHAISHRQLRKMLPANMQGLSSAEIEERCFDELSVMSKKRVRAVMAGHDLSCTSSSESESDEPDDEPVPLVPDAPAQKVSNRNEAVKESLDADYSYDSDESANARAKQEQPITVQTISDSESAHLSDTEPFDEDALLEQADQLLPMEDDIESGSDVAGVAEALENLRQTERELKQLEEGECDSDALDQTPSTQPWQTKDSEIYVAAEHKAREQAIASIERRQTTTEGDEGELIETPSTSVVAQYLQSQTVEPDLVTCNDNLNADTVLDVLKDTEQTQTDTEVVGIEPDKDTEQTQTDTEVVGIEPDKDTEQTQTDTEVVGIEPDKDTEQTQTDTEVVGIEPDKDTEQTQTDTEVVGIEPDKDTEQTQTDTEVVGIEPDKDTEQTQTDTEVVGIEPDKDTEQTQTDTEVVGIEPDKDTEQTQTDTEVVGIEPDKDTEQTQTDTEVVGIEPDKDTEQTQTGTEVVGIEPDKDTEQTQTDTEVVGIEPDKQMDESQSHTQPDTTDKGKDTSAVLDTNCSATAEHMRESGDNEPVIVPVFDQIIEEPVSDHDEPASDQDEVVNDTCVSTDAVDNEEDDAAIAEQRFRRRLRERQLQRDTDKDTTDTDAHCVAADTQDNHHSNSTHAQLQLEESAAVPAGGTSCLVLPAPPIAPNLQSITFSQSPSSTVNRPISPEPEESQFDLADSDEEQPAVARLDSVDDENSSDDTSSASSQPVSDAESEQLEYGPVTRPNDWPVTDQAMGCAVHSNTPTAESAQAPDTVMVAEDDPQPALGESESAVAIEDSHVQEAQGLEQEEDSDSDRSVSPELEADLGPDDDLYFGASESVQLSTNERVGAKQKVNIVPPLHLQHKDEHGHKIDDYDSDGELDSSEESEPEPGSMQPPGLESIEHSRLRAAKARCAKAKQQPGMDTEEGTEEATGSKRERSTVLNVLTLYKQLRAEREAKKNRKPPKVYGAELREEERELRYKKQKALDEAKRLREELEGQAAAGPDMPPPDYFYEAPASSEQTGADGDGIADDAPVSATHSEAVPPVELVPKKRKKQKGDEILTEQFLADLDRKRAEHDHLMKLQKQQLQELKNKRHQLVRRKKEAAGKHAPDRFAAVKKELSDTEIEATLTDAQSREVRKRGKRCAEDKDRVHSTGRSRHKQGTTDHEQAVPVTVPKTEPHSEPVNPEPPSEPSSPAALPVSSMMSKDPVALQPLATPQSATPASENKSAEPELELFELEMRARAIKALMNRPADEDEQPAADTKTDVDGH